MLVDTELIGRSLCSHNVAFTEVFAAYRKRIFGRIALLIGRPEEDAQDVVQEVLLRLHYSLRQLSTPELLTRGYTAGRQMRRMITRDEPGALGIATMSPETPDRLARLQPNLYGDLE